MTNRKVINPNVCKIEHNNKFSNQFEYKIIKELAFITNSLSVKSSKSKDYLPYEITYEIEGESFKSKMGSEAKKFHNKKMKSIDGKTLLAPLDELRKINNINENDIKEIDVNKIEITESINFDLNIFFSKEMYRLMAKIAFEWYCLKNNINFKVNDFEPIIQYITQGIGDKIVNIVKNEKIMNLIKSRISFGSHTFLSYVGQDNSVNILISFFGIAIYNVRICDSVLYKYNFTVQELKLDGKSDEFKYDFPEKVFCNFSNNLEKSNSSKDFKIFFIKNGSHLFYWKALLYFNNYKIFQDSLMYGCNQDYEVASFICKNIQEILSSQSIHLKGLKRFVTEFFEDFDQEVRLNPNSDNSKGILKLYMIFLVGHSENNIENLSDLQKVIQTKISSEIVNEDVISKLYSEIISQENYSDILINGGQRINRWNHQN
ncbi:hypothetical protein [Jeotgalicoccus psychrophilus]|uniref:hypothetical protein n=1 Tax=Jeotgalicoccus psychrophilus TaxID=157228 RepID=UPI00040ED5AC|nr:hypothetical protein [Jeotgalicoccus psychrophilus]